MPELPADDQVPHDMIQTMADGAEVLHEMLLSFVDAGFTRDESLQFVMAAFVQALQGGQS